MKRFHRLNEEEHAILIDKATEAPFSSSYEDFFAPGIFVCKQCDAPLYLSSAKFASGCGWPSFDDELPQAVKREVDADQKRTEILCARCDGHLGHVFMGEGFTPKNTRHCVNGQSMRFVSALSSDGFPRAIFAGGCFWGMEYYFQKVAGVLRVRSGYTGGHVVRPNYQEVCSGLTGHREAIEVVYDDKIISFLELAKLFFEIHDPTQKDGQGPDKGYRYTSAIYYLTQEQKTIALSLIALLQEKGFEVATEILPASVFYEAEEYHQNYYQKKQQQPYCHARVKRF